MHLALLVDTLLESKYPVTHKQYSIKKLILSNLTRINVIFLEFILGWRNEKNKTKETLFNVKNKIKRIKNSRLRVCF